MRGGDVIREEILKSEHLHHIFSGRKLLANVAIPAGCFLHKLTKLHGKQRWKDAKGRLYEWDRLHGHIEQYSPHGVHMGVLDANGKYIGKSIKGRKITP